MKLLFYRIMFEVINNIGEVLCSIISSIIAIIVAYYIYSIEKETFPSAWYLWVAFSSFGLLGLSTGMSAVSDIIRPLKYVLTKWIEKLEDQELNKTNK